MTLAIIDALTPGELTGGKRVAVTGTIDPDGNVGEIGGLPQKALAARARARADLHRPRAAADDGCQTGSSRPRASASGKNVEVAPVSTLAEALKVLRDAGGAPVPARLEPESPAPGTIGTCDPESRRRSAGRARFVQYDVDRAEMSRKIPGLSDD